MPNPNSDFLDPWVLQIKNYYKKYITWLEIQDVINQFNYGFQTRGELSWISIKEKHPSIVPIKGSDFSYEEKKAITLKLLNLTLKFFKEKQAIFAKQLYWLIDSQHDPFKPESATQKLAISETKQIHAKYTRIVEHLDKILNEPTKLPPQQKPLAPTADSSHPANHHKLIVLLALLLIPLTAFLSLLLLLLLKKNTAQPLKPMETAIKANAIKANTWQKVSHSDTPCSQPPTSSIYSRATLPSREDSNRFASEVYNKHHPQTPLDTITPGSQGANSLDTVTPLPTLAASTDIQPATPPTEITCSKLPKRSLRPSRLPLHFYTSSADELVEKISRKLTQANPENQPELLSSNPISRH